jgi:hypothetical protein
MTAATARIMLGAACSTCAALLATSADPAATARAARSMPHASRAWPERVVAHEGVMISNPVVSGGFLYALISQTHTPARGPYRLERTNLRSGVVRTGPRFSVGRLTVASGYLWVSGTSGSRLRVFEVDPHTLRVVRSLRLSAVPSYGLFAVAAGPAGSVWLGSWRTLERVAAASGAVRARVLLPANLTVAGLAVDLSGRYLYVAVAHVVKGGVEGALLFEYDARSGRKLAGPARGLLRDSTLGAALTAVPGGVWASFRTGMLGLTIHLRQQDLSMIAPPGPRIALRPANGLFHWPMDASTLYGGGALWLANDAGIVACLNPQSGKARALEHVPPSGWLGLLSADPHSQRLYASGVTGDLVLQLTPPRRCWR